VRDSEQDRHYLDREADAFFERNFSDADPQTLRPLKARIVAALEEAGVRPKRMLEFGCNYGDMLDYYAREQGADCVGVEPSLAAVNFGQKVYNSSLRLLQGTMAENEISRDPSTHGAFDLVVVDDVFCWVSRETLFQSIAHVDDAVADGGFLFIREFLPLASRRNRNHHVEGADVYCYKPAGPHHRIFTSSGIYEVVWQQVWLDHQDGWVQSGNRDAFESRWSDTILRKSYGDYFDTASS